MCIQAKPVLKRPDLPIPEQEMLPFLDQPVSRGASESPNCDQSPLLPAYKLDNWRDILQGSDNFNPGELSSDEDNEVFRCLGLWNNEEEVDGDLRAQDNVPAEKEELSPDDPVKQDRVFVNDLLAPLGANLTIQTPKMMVISTQNHLHVCGTILPFTTYIYICTYISAPFHATVSHNLESKEHLLCTAQSANPDIKYPGLDRFAHTLLTLLKHLGLTTDHFIVYLFVGNICWKLHHPSELNNLETPHCNAEDCPGLPTNIVLYVPPECALQWIFLHPGKWDQF